MISQETLDQILDRGSILDFTGELSGVKNQSGGVFALCPFHQEKSGSFHIREGGKFYHCFGCGASGNFFSFIMKIYGLGFPEAVEHAAQKYGIEVKRSSIKKINPESRLREKLKKLNLIAGHYFVDQLKNAQKPIIEYLSSRGIRDETQSLFQLGYAPDEWRGLTDHLKKKNAPEELMLHSGLVKRNSKGELYDALRGRIVFPIFGSDKVLVGFGGRILPAFDSDGAPKYLNSPETSLYNKSRVLYGLHLAQRAARYEKQIYLVEGYFDVISLYQSGIENVVATCGTAVTPGHVGTFKRFVPKATILFDGDDAGRDAAAKAFSCFVNSGMEANACFFSQGEDPDTFAKSHGSSTKGELEKLPTESLFDCFVDYKARSAGAESRNNLSPRQKALVAGEVGEVLSTTKNPIELDEYVKRAAYLLKTDADLLKELLGKDLKDREARLQRTQSRSVPLEDPDSSGTPDPAEFSHPHRLLLRAVMILKEDALKELDELSEIYGTLPHGLMFFCESFREVIVKEFDSLGSQKKAVRELLVAFGEKWVEFWKESYEIAKDPDVDFHRLLQEAIVRIREEGVLESIQVLDATIGEGVPEERREELLQTRLNLTRKLRTLRSGTLNAA